MKGWPYGHLHTGNILVDNRKCRFVGLCLHPNSGHPHDSPHNGCLLRAQRLLCERRLSDLENCILGVPPLHLDRIMAWKRCTNVWEADVVCFGAVLYEMTTGQELPAEGLPPRYPDGTSERVKDVLESIFRPSKPLPTIDDLLKMAYFASVEMVRPTTIKGDRAGKTLTCVPSAIIITLHLAFTKGDIPSKFKRTTKVKELLTAAAPQYQNILARYKAAAKANRTAAASAATPAASGPDGASVAYACPARYTGSPEQLPYMFLTPHSSTSKIDFGYPGSSRHCGRWESRGRRRNTW